MFRQRVKQTINQRRNQMIIHSILYYRYDLVIVDDKQFDKWAYELRDLQILYPEIASTCPYNEDFDGWDGTTGFNLNLLGDPYMQRKALSIYETHEKREQQ